MAKHAIQIQIDFLKDFKKLIKKYEAEFELTGKSLYVVAGGITIYLGNGINEEKISEMIPDYESELEDCLIND